MCSANEVSDNFRCRRQLDFPADNVFTDDDDD